MSNTTTHVSRANVHNAIIWTAAMPSASQADAMSAWVRDLATQEHDFRGLACRLSMMGAELIYNPDFHGDRDTWTIRIKPNSWLAANVNQLAAIATT